MAQGSTDHGGAVGYNTGGGGGSNYHQVKMEMFLELSFYFPLIITENLVRIPKKNKNKNQPFSQFFCSTNHIPI